MANYNTFSENHQVQLLLAPADQGDLTTSYVAPFADGGGANRATFFAVIGATTEEFDMSLLQATDSSGTGSKAIAGAAITQITSSTDEVIVSIEIGPGALDDIGGFKYVAAQVVLDGSGTCPYTVFLVKHQLRRPGDFTQDATYAEAIEVNSIPA